MKKKVKKALSKAKALEKHEPLSKTELDKIRAKTEKSANKLRKLLSPSWFMSGLGVLKQKGKVKKTKKSTRKTTKASKTKTTRKR